MIATMSARKPLTQRNTRNHITPTTINLVFPQNATPCPMNLTESTTLPNALSALSTTCKRPRSPEHDYDNTLPAKRLRAGNRLHLPPQEETPLKASMKATLLTAMVTRDSASLAASKRRTKDQKEKDSFVFKTAYSQAFPGFRFYFDAVPNAIRDMMAKRITGLGGSIDEFFSKDITHFITNRRPANAGGEEADKENAKPRSLGKGASSLRSPIKLRSKQEENFAKFDLLSQAQQYNLKIWNTTKLDSVLSRILGTDAPMPKQPNFSLNQLLTTERMQNTTLERDQKARRHDFEYFEKGSYFLLVEDIAAEVCPIAIRQYAKPKHGASPADVEYPILHADSRVRNPFVAFDERQVALEKRRERLEARDEAERAEQLVRVRMKKQTDLRRSASMISLGRKRAMSFTTLAGESVLDDSMQLQPHASGYMAASGNSVAITSTNTTSMISINSNGMLKNALRLSKRTHEVLTNRAFGSNKDMPPPPLAAPMLRKSKSTTTLRLPAREETKKPGYCECCRSKFDDFTVHVKSTKHRRFAKNTQNFASLDEVIMRVSRKALV